jgi:hypothetical protein
MKDDNEDILGHDVDTEGRIELTSHNEYVRSHSVK